MTKHALILALASLAWPMSALAACDNPRNQQELNNCATDRHAVADKALNQGYAAYLQRLSGIQRKQFRQAQSAWIKFRDASCAFESSGVEKGSAHPMVHRQCLAAKTEERVQQIQALTSCQEGDLSCPAPR
jgi:uncharacterized protein YecT (DUF1311 family)